MRIGRSRLAVVAIALALLGLAIASYLVIVRAAGELPVCGAAGGCETVALSDYSVIAGVPIALLGVVFSAAIVLLTAAWWASGDRRFPLAAYGLGLFGVVVVAYLSYLELFVIRAICAWCVAYAATVMGGWIAAALALRGMPPA